MARSFGREPIARHTSTDGELSMRSRPFASFQERLALWILTITFALILGIHAGVETLFVLPANPLGELFRPAVLGYTHPYFEQYWNVFAPTPIESDVTVLARTRATRGAPSAWVNLTDPLLDEVRANPLSRYSTLKIIAMTLSVATLDDKVLGKGKLTRAQTNEVVDPRTRPMILEGLVRLALFLRAGDGPNSRGVQIAIMQHRFPRFTHRFEPDNRQQQNETLLFPWLPIDSATAAGVSS